MKNMTKMSLILFLVCGIAAGSLAFVNKATKDRIAEFARIEKAEALKEVFPGVEEFKEILPGRQWEALRAGQRQGYVFSALVQGYSGPVEALFGLDLRNAITGVRVIRHNETPGLGAKITGEKFLGQFQGRAREAVALKKDDPAGAIDAIAAATISSRAVTHSIRSVIDSFLKGELK